MDESELILCKLNGCYVQ